MTSTLARSNVAVGLTIFSVAIAGLLVWYGGELPKNSFPAVNLTMEQQNLLAMVTYLNANGQKWSIPTGEYAFNVSSNPKYYPRFISGDIDPLDVKVGDTQNMKIVVVDVAQPKSVWAEVEHDAGKDRVELTLTGTKALAREELEKRPYLVDETGELILNDASSKLSVKSIVEKLVSRAEAEGEAEYTYEGSWVVHDTHTKTYRTTFNAESRAGKRDDFVMAWSDPVCPFSLLGGVGVLGSSCSPSAGDIEGFDGASANLGAYSVNLSPGAEFVFNPGTSLNLSGGAKFGDAIPIQGGAVIKKGYIYYLDQDGDGYTNDVRRYVFPTTSQSGYVRAMSVSGATNPANAQVPPTANLDCYDSGTNAASAHPGQISLFTTPRGDGSFDYNCNNGIERGIGYVWLGLEAYCDDQDGKVARIFGTDSQEVVDYERHEGADVFDNLTQAPPPAFPACGATHTKRSVVLCNSPLGLLMARVVSPASQVIANCR